MAATCFNQINRKMEESVTSDKTNHTMLVNATFHHILEEVQNSSLNFQLKVSPFSAIIALKKSFIKDKSGNLLLPSPRYASSENIGVICERNKQLEKDMKMLAEMHEHVVNNCENAYEIIKSLKEKQQEEKIKVKEATPNNENQLVAEIKNLKTALKDRDDEIANLKIANKAAKEASEILNKKLTETRLKGEQEKAKLRKEHKAEVKARKKDLGETINKKIKLEKKLKELTDHCSSSTSSSGSTSIPGASEAEVPNTENVTLGNQSPYSDTMCSICADPIPNYKPKYFLGEIFNPACDNCDDSFEGDDTGPDHNGCKHTPVCVIRQPHPPPSPAITHLVNERSKYHEHMMSPGGVPGRYPGHEKCMDAYSKNYGCDDCVWLKWFGEIHGYPDIHPSDFRKHLEPAEWEIVRSKM